MPLPEERIIAKATYPAPFVTVGGHTRLVLAVAGDYIKRLDTSSHLQLQALVEDVSYTTDDSVATATHGFVLTAGQIATIPCPNIGISLFPIVLGAVVQFQWIR